MHLRFLEVELFTYYYLDIGFTVNKKVPGNFIIETKRTPEFSILLMKIRLFHVLEISSGPIGVETVSDETENPAKTLQTFSKVPLRHPNRQVVF